MTKDTIEIAKECGLLACIDDCYLERGDYDKPLQAFRDSVEAPLLKQNAMLRDALNRITEIEHKLCGGDWEEIEEAQAIAKEALSATAESTEAWLREEKAKYEWLWSRCKIIFFPAHDDTFSTYPIEHNPHARKDGRMFIEAKMAAELRKNGGK